MNRHREFEIAWLGLKDGVHSYEYEVDDRVLYELGYNHPDFENLKVAVNLNFEKENSFFLLHFSINGTTDVVCDRCGDPFTLQLWDEFDLVVKLTDSEEKAKQMNEQWEDADVVFIPRSETVINIFEWVYEFIMLSFPIQKVHPDSENGDSGCNPEAIKLLNKLREIAPEKVANRWKGLEQFKDKISDN